MRSLNNGSPCWETGGGANFNDNPVRLGKQSSTKRLCPSTMQYFIIYSPRHLLHRNEFEGGDVFSRLQLKQTASCLDHCILCVDHDASPPRESSVCRYEQVPVAWGEVPASLSSRRPRSLWPLAGARLSFLGRPLCCHPPAETLPRKEQAPLRFGPQKPRDGSCCMTSSCPCRRARLYRSA